MQARKTHEQQLRILQRKPDVPDRRQMDAALAEHETSDQPRRPRTGARESEYAVSRGGLNQEDRQHNKHNHQTQSGHKPHQR